MKKLYYVSVLKQDADMFESYAVAANTPKEAADYVIDNLDDRFSILYVKAVKTGRQVYLIMKKL